MTSAVWVVLSFLFFVTAVNHLGGDSCKNISNTIVIPTLQSNDDLTDTSSDEESPKPVEEPLPPQKTNGTTDTNSDEDSPKPVEEQAPQKAENKRTFVVDYENNQFLKDGKPFSYISGEIHYFRVPFRYWKDRLEKLKAIGCTTVSTYIEWSFHEPEPGHTYFTGDQNIVNFITIAKELDLTVILRPGPFICAERDLGGFPSWLLTVNPKMKLRTSDPVFKHYVERWFNVLFPKLQPHLYGNGGNVIMVQVENKYGSYPDTDTKYLIWLRDLMKQYVGDAAVLFTTDGCAPELISKGKIPEVFATVDFGPSHNSIEKIFAPLRAVQPKGPLVNSELYVGWLTYWGKPMSKTDTFAITHTIKALLERNISFNMYLLHGGTNFNFTNGAGTDPRYVSVITSCDYDAPISEIGDLTPKYEAIRETILLHRNEFTPLTIQKISEKGLYGKLMLKPVFSSLFDPTFGKTYENKTFPSAMEELGQYHGFISYSTVLQIPPQDPCVLKAQIRDRAIVYLDDVEIGTLLYTAIDQLALPPTYRPGQTLRILVECMGRKNYGVLSDVTKGIVGVVTIDDQQMLDWKITDYSLNPRDIVLMLCTEETVEKYSFPTVFRGVFVVPEGEEPKDSYVCLENWGKGMLYINGHNLGRYWHIGPQVSLFLPSIYLYKYPRENRLGILFVNGFILGRYWHIGPQVSFYVPRFYLHKYPRENIVVVLELHFYKDSPSATFVDNLMINKPTQVFWPY